MSIKSGLKNAGIYVAGLLILIAVWFVGLLMLHGMVWASEKLLPWLEIAGAIAFMVCLLMLPLCLFRKTRQFAGGVFYFASFFFGALLWAFSCLVTVDIWGFFGLIVGLIIAGVGVVPVAFLAALFHGEWSLMWQIVLGVVLTFGTRAFGMFASTKGAKEPELAPAEVLDAEIARLAYREIE